ncbi:hypothetical protein CLOP_g7288 [Closterium sp. NIES-67]|nr:hypothetical protein CLOP_g7288 [Closterium sp. NIES-67]
MRASGPCAVHGRAVAEGPQLPAVQLRLRRPHAAEARYSELQAKLPSPGLRHLPRSARGRDARGRAVVDGADGEGGGRHGKGRGARVERNGEGGGCDAGEPQQGHRGGVAAFLSHRRQRPGDQLHHQSLGPARPWCLRQRFFPRSPHLPALSGPAAAGGRPPARGVGRRGRPRQPQACQRGTDDVIVHIPVIGR